MMLCRKRLYGACPGQTCPAQVQDFATFDGAIACLEAIESGQDRRNARPTASGRTRRTSAFGAGYHVMLVSTIYRNQAPMTTMDTAASTQVVSVVKRLIIFMAMVRPLEESRFVACLR